MTINKKGWQTRGKLRKLKMKKKRKKVKIQITLKNLMIIKVKK